MVGEDISRNTIFVLVILTLLISILGTWTVLTQVNAGPVARPDVGSPVAGGTVGFTLQAPAEPKLDDTTGRATFEIVRS